MSDTYNHINVNSAPPNINVYTLIPLTSSLLSAPVTTWYKSIYYSGNDYTKISGSNYSNSPLRRQAAGTSSVAAGKTTTSGNPWCVSVVAKYSGTNDTNTLIAQSNGSDANSARAWLYISSSKKLVFQYGTDFNNLKFTSTDNITAWEWKGFYVDYNGGNTGSASGSVSDYYSRFRIKQISLETGLVEDVSGTWSHLNYGFSNNIAGKTFIGSLYNATHNITGWIGGAVVSTLCLDVNLPDDDEVSLIVSDPMKWLTDYRVGNPWRKPNFLYNNTSFAINPTNENAGGLGIKVYLMGDGPTDAYSTIKSQVSTQYSSANLIMSSMSADNIQVSDFPFNYSVTFTSSVGASDTMTIMSSGGSNYGIYVGGNLVGSMDQVNPNLSNFLTNENGVVWRLDVIFNLDGSYVTVPFGTAESGHTIPAGQYNYTTDRVNTFLR